VPLSSKSAAREAKSYRDDLARNQQRLVLFGLAKASISKTNTPKPASTPRFTEVWKDAASKSPPLATASLTRGQDIPVCH